MKTVQIYRLIAQNTIDEYIQQVQSRKLRLDSAVVRTTGKGDVTRDDVMFMASYGANKIFEMKSSVTDEDIDELIEEGKKKAEELNA